MLPPEVEFEIRTHQTFRDLCRQELNFRKLSGRKYRPDMRELTDEELQEQIDFSCRKIDELLAPYEIEEG